jgi:hypothetical protein
MHRAGGRPVAGIVCQTAERRCTGQLRPGETGAVTGSQLARRSSAAPSTAGRPEQARCQRAGLYVAGATAPVTLVHAGTHGPIHCVRSAA